MLLVHMYHMPLYEKGIDCLCVSGCWFKHNPGFPADPILRNRHHTHYLVYGPEVLEVGNSRGDLRDITGPGIDNHFWELSLFALEMTFLNIAKSFSAFLNA